MCAERFVTVNSIPSRPGCSPGASLWPLPASASDACSSLSDLVTCTPPRKTSSVTGSPVRLRTSPAFTVNATEASLAS
ncbi:MAG: hypothetical protein ACLUCC_09100 [Eggerthella lenta]